MQGSPACSGIRTGGTKLQKNKILWENCRRFTFRFVSDAKKMMQQKKADLFSRPFCGVEGTRFSTSLSTL